MPNAPSSLAVPRSGLHRVEVDLAPVTPIFCGGASQQLSEWRLSSLKGQLRFWYRAWNAAASHPFSGMEAWREDAVFGGAGLFGEPSLADSNAGQCPFLMELAPRREETREFSFSAASPGLKYLAFPLRDSRPGHRFLVPGRQATVTVRMIFPRPGRVTFEGLRGLLASWWLFAHLGALGFRARRGFGSIALTGWRTNWADAEDAMSSLPLPATAHDGLAYTRALRAGLNVLSGWLPESHRWPRQNRHPSMGAAAGVVVTPMPRSGSMDWMGILSTIGDELKAFRKEIAERERRHKEGASARVTLGLPMNTTLERHSPQWLPWRRRRSTASAGKRHASPVHIRLARAGGEWVPCWVFLDGPVPGLDRYRVVLVGGRDSKDPSPVSAAGNAGMQLRERLQGYADASWIPFEMGAPR
ncbi:MAG: hypothetical protein HY303_11205 [Candidatus Wallbacteria bacterium]|nr:hypothetical protein [Candidatus Wallbacteria bacterium]